METSNLSYRYSAKGPAVVDNLSLQVPEKSIYGFLGHNGAGKTTTIRLLLGLLNTVYPVKLFGQELKQNAQGILSRVGALIEHPSLYGNLTAAENMQVICRYRRLSFGGIPGILETVGLGKHANRKTKDFSTGMKQRLGLAIALLGDPELIILDEPTNGLDPQGILEMRELIKKLNQEKGKTIFLSSHLLAEVEKVCTHVGIIRQGRMLFQGSVTQLTELYKSSQVPVLIETDDNEGTRKLLEQHGFECRIEGLQLLTYLSSRSAIPALIDQIRNSGIGIYQIKAESKNLEELFFSLHNDPNSGT
ncbi:ABC transporter ATP-binding protein [Anseongella ginsenosidimutans]|nr:ABC transporter ATP-binding protein [Anseongella ginsenosidimutans]QEC51742.1 ABC transporter ATP-binding protein [Anseongella ginsenosidimutans]